MRRVNLDVRATGFRNPGMAQALVTEAKGRAKTAMAQLGFTPKTLEVMVVPDHAKEAGSIGFAGGRIVISPLDLKDTLYEHAIGHLALANASKNAGGPASNLARLQARARRETSHEATRAELRNHVERGLPFTPKLHADIQAFIKSDAELARVNVGSSPKARRITYALDELFADAATVQVTRQLHGSGTHTDFASAPRVVANEPHGMLKTTPARSWLGTFFKKAGFNDPAVMKALSDAVLKLMNQQARRGELSPAELNRALRRELMPILRKHLSRAQLQQQVVQPRSMPPAMPMDLARVFQLLSEKLNTFDVHLETGPQMVPWRTTVGSTTAKRR